MPTPDHSRDAGGRKRQLVIILTVATGCRVVLNTARRFAYPFAPAFSRALNVPLTAITSMIAANQAGGVLAMLSGPLADRFGYRVMMLSAMGMLTAGMLAAGMAPSYGAVLVCLLLAGLSKNIFDPAIQAYVGERVAYRQRGAVIGVMEFSWSASTLLGIPLIGLLLARFGWRSPFFALGAAGLLGLLAIGTVVQANGQCRPAGRHTGSLPQAWRQLARHRPALGALGFAFFVSMANDNLFVVYGAWLESAFHLSVVAIGMGTGLLGAAEFAGETLTAALSDRIGLKRAVCSGLCLSLFSYLLLPLAAPSLALTLASLFAVFLVFEFTMVAFISLATELIPELRATTMSAVFACAGLGRVSGSLIGGRVWQIGGIRATAAVSAGITAMALMALLWGLRHWHGK